MEVKWELRTRILFCQRSVSFCSCANTAVLTSAKITPFFSAIRGLTILLFQEIVRFSASCRPELLIHFCHTNVQQRRLEWLRPPEAIQVRYGLIYGSIWFSFCPQYFVHCARLSDACHWVNVSDLTAVLYLSRVPLLELSHFSHFWLEASFLPTRCQLVSAARNFFASSYLSCLVQTRF